MSNFHEKIESKIELKHQSKQLTVGLSLSIIGAILFSAKSIIAKLAYAQGIDAVQLITYRMLMALPFFLGIAWWQNRKLPALSRADLCQVLGLGLVGYYLSSFLDFLGLQYISASLERLILFLTPAIVLLISRVVLGKAISRWQWGAMAVSYFGIVLVFVHDALQGAANVVLGSVLVLGSAITYAIYLLASGALLKRVGAIRLVAYAMCMSCLACMLQFILIRPWSALIVPEPVLWLSALNATLCTVAPVFLTMLGVARIGAAKASQAGMVGPVSTLLLSVWILHEPLTLWQILGAGFVLLGVYFLAKQTHQNSL